MAVVQVLTATAWFDLSDALPERMRNRLAALPEVPSNARAIVYVGASAAEPTAVRLLVEHERRLHVDVQGTPRAVGLWFRAIHEHLDEVLL